MTPEMKAAIDAVQKNFADFKEANDENIAAIAGGVADPLIENKVDAVNAALTESIEAVNALQEDQAKRLDQLEASANRPGIGHNSGDLAQAAHDFGVMAGVDGFDVDSYVAYQDGFRNYMRQGPKAINAAMSVGEDPSGGYWVTPDQGGKLVELIYESSPMRQLADVVSISTDAIEGFHDLEEGSCGWVSESGSRTETTTPEVGKYRIDVHEMYAMPRTTQRILDDASFDVEGWLNRKVGAKMGRTETTAFFTGTGVGQPRGILTHTAGTPSSSAFNVIEQTNSGAAGAFHATLPGDYVIDMVFGLKSEYRSGARFVMNRSTVAAVRKLKDGDGNYLWQPNFSNLQESMMVGFGITECEDMPDIAADSLSIAFGNFREAYQIVDNSATTVLRDPYTTKGSVKFYSTRRVGGDVVNFDAVKIMKFAV